MNQQSLDEILELIWILREEGISGVKELIKRVEEDDIEKLLEHLVEEGFIEISGDTVRFKKEGEKRASDIIRRHRLAERLFADVFELDIDESTACQFEHILDSRVADSICTLLGHPPVCPHGRPIPRNECCNKFSIEVKSLILRLSDLDIGESGKIVFMVPSDHNRLDRLGALGVIPGTIVKLHQKNPTFVIQIDETTIALDSEIAREIYVKKV
ncbi:MAG: metal-dependent transcriptional regulator [Nitrospirota bacterium]